MTDKTTDLAFSARAFAKIILHAAKYPHCAINGLLLGKQKSHEFHIVDAIPLFHICLHVSPMAEIALTTVEQMANSKGLVIAGYYFANENINDLSIDKPAHRGISDKIVENLGNAIVAVVNNKELITSLDESPLKISHYSDGKLKFREKSTIQYEDEKYIMDVVYLLIKAKAYRNLVDFDNHLDDISLDWRNLQLNEVIENKIKNDCE